jgi:hypothetical protein
MVLKQKALFARKLTRVEPISPVGVPFRLFSPFFALMGANPPASKKDENISKSTAERWK